MGTIFANIFQHDHSVILQFFWFAKLFNDGDLNTEVDERKKTQTKNPYSLCFIKFWKVFLNLIYLKLVLWLLMMIWKVKQPISLLWTKNVKSTKVIILTLRVIFKQNENSIPIGTKLRIHFNHQQNAEGKGPISNVE